VHSLTANDLSSTLHRLSPASRTAIQLLCLFIILFLFIYYYVLFIIFIFYYDSNMLRRCTHTQVTAFRTAISISEQQYNGWFGLGEVYERQERFALAEIHFW
jgi:hypothetical protein